MLISLIAVTISQYIQMLYSWNYYISIEPQLKKKKGNVKNPLRTEVKNTLALGCWLPPLIYSFWNFEIIEKKIYKNNNNKNVFLRNLAAFTY